MLYGYEAWRRKCVASAFNIIQTSNYTYKNMATFDEIDMGKKENYE